MGRLHDDVALLRLCGYTEPERLAPATIVAIKERVRRARATLYGESSSILRSLVADVIQGGSNVSETLKVLGR